MNSNQSQQTKQVQSFNVSNAVNSVDSKEEESSKSNQLQKVDDGQFETNWKEKCESFEHMKLSESLLRGIYAFGWEKPSDIQQRAIPAVIAGHDVIAQAQSGRGKTGAFLIAALKRVHLDRKQCQVLILATTRELADQHYKVLHALGGYYDDLMVHKCVGGTRVRDDIVALSGGRQIVVGTPGRVLDMISRGALSVKILEMLVLDEADEMFQIGFKEQIYDIFQYLPVTVQVALFSATMPLDVLQLTRKFMRDPVRILVKNDELTLDGIKQFYIAVQEEQWKLATLVDLYESIAIQQAMIFVSQRRKAVWLQDQMRQRDFTTGCIHGAMTTLERQQMMKEFRSGSTRVLISTDLLARGIDVQSVSLVINFDLPRDKENYIHRIGRSGRFGRKGCAINFVTDSEEQMLCELQQFYQTKINELPAELEGIISN